MANYRNVRPVGQMDEMACWAACLAWWLKALGNRPRWSQEDILVKFVDMTDAYAPRLRRLARRAGPARGRASGYPAGST